MILEQKQIAGHNISVITAEEAGLNNADEFRLALLALVDGGTKNIVLSFENVTYIDSSFLGSLVVGLKHAIAKGAEIYLVHLRDDIYDLLCLIRMNKVFKIYRTAEQAIATF